MASRKRKRDDAWNSERLSYLGRLVSEYGTTRSKDAKRQVIANVANFAYDPINYEFLRALNVIGIFLDLLKADDNQLVEYAIGGLTNMACCEKNRIIIVERGLDDIVGCLSKENSETVISSLTLLIFLKPSVLADSHIPAVISQLRHLQKSENARIRNLATNDKMTIGLLNKCGLLSSRITGLLANQSRSVAQIPWWEYHMRFSPIDGRKRPCKDVLDRFKRLNNGLWIRTYPARFHKRYWKSQWYIDKADQHYTVPSLEVQMLHKMVNNFWLRPKYYVDDIYEPYNVRHGLKTPRADERGNMLRERKKILLEDTVADQHFYDR